MPVRVAGGEEFSTNSERENVPAIASTGGDYAVKVAC
jgi:hypothetical protein